MPDRMNGSLTSPVRAVRQPSDMAQSSSSAPSRSGKPRARLLVAQLRKRSGGGSAAIVFNTPQTVQVTAAGLGLMLLLGSGVLLVVVKACSRIGAHRLSQRTPEAFNTRQPPGAISTRRPPADVV